MVKKICIIIITIITLLLLLYITCGIASDSEVNISDAIPTQKITTPKNQELCNDTGLQFEEKINIPVSDKTFMNLYAWPVVFASQNPVTLLKSDVDIVIETLSYSSFAEIGEDHDAFNAGLTVINNTGETTSGDVFDTYILIHPYDFREELVEKMNIASREELETLIKPMCVLIHDYNIEKQDDFVYFVFDEKYYLADDTSEVFIIEMLNSLVEKYSELEQQLYHENEG